jgi:phage antirepressor YoqD-like protein
VQPEGHDGGCPIYLDADAAPQTTMLAVAAAPDPWSVPVEPEADSVIGMLDFHGSAIPILIDDRGRWASVTALCRAMGVDGEAQRKMILRKHWSQTWTSTMAAKVPGDLQRRPHFFLHEKRVPMWLASIDTTRLRDSTARARVEATQVEFADVLAEWTETGRVEPKSDTPASVADALSKGWSPGDIARLVIAQEERALSAERRVAELEPSAQAHEAFEAADGEYPLGVAAKIVGTGQNRLFELLRDRDVLISDGHLRNTPYQPFIDRGYFRVVRRTHVDDDGRTHVTYTTCVRPAGLDYLRRLLAGDE